MVRTFFLAEPYRENRVQDLMTASIWRRALEQTWRWRYARAYASRWSGRPHLNILLDFPAYNSTNCYQHQLLETLSTHFALKIFPLKDVHAGARIPRSALPTLSVLRFRVLAKSLEQVRTALGDQPILVYDQDPWESFMDGGVTRGMYSEVRDRLNLRAFILTSPFWQRFVTAQKIPATFTPIGVLPRYCRQGLTFEARPHQLAFQGRLHAYRKAYLDTLAAKGYPVQVLPYSDYHGFLGSMDRTQIFTHTEDARLTIDGKETTYSVSWVKAVEIAGRGAFVVRDHEPEGYDAHDIRSIPTVFTFQTPNDAPAIIDRIRAMNPRERQDLQRAAVSIIQKRNDWSRLPRIIMQNERHLENSLS